MTGLMLDTNIASAIIKGKIDPVQSLKDRPWCISAVTRSELVFGVALLPKAVKLARLVSAFLSFAQTAAWDEAAADRHGHLRAELRLSGTPIGGADEMIAAHAVALDCILVTDNLKHFKRVKGLRLENWLR